MTVGSKFHQTIDVGVKTGTLTPEVTNLLRTALSARPAPSVLQMAKEKATEGYGDLDIHIWSGKLFGGIDIAKLVYRHNAQKGSWELSPYGYVTVFQRLDYIDEIVVMPCADDGFPIDYLVRDNDEIRGSTVIASKASRNKIHSSIEEMAYSFYRKNPDRGISCSEVSLNEETVRIKLHCSFPQIDNPLEASSCAAAKAEYVKMINLLSSIASELTERSAAQRRLASMVLI